MWATPIWCAASSKPACRSSRRTSRSRVTRRIASPRIATSNCCTAAQLERLLVLSPSREQIAAVVGRLRGNGAAGEQSEDAASFCAVPMPARTACCLLGPIRSGRRRWCTGPWPRNESPRNDGGVRRAQPAADRMRDVRPWRHRRRRPSRGGRAVQAWPSAPGVQPVADRADWRRRTRRHVPGDAAIVAAIGLNPPTAGGVKADTSAAPPQIALMDLGREFFANVRSATVFAAPGSGPIPEIGIVVFAQDAGKSRELWTQLIGLPTRSARCAEAAGEVEIAGHKATRYAYPNVPPIFVSQTSEDALVIGTAGAVETSLAAGRSRATPRRRPGCATPTRRRARRCFCSSARSRDLRRTTPMGGRREHIAALVPILDEDDRESHNRRRSERASRAAGCRWRATRGRRAADSWRVGASATPRACRRRNIDLRCRARSAKSSSGVRTRCVAMRLDAEGRQALAADESPPTAGARTVEARRAVGGVQASAWRLGCTFDSLSSPPGGGLRPPLRADGPFLGHRFTSDVLDEPD